MKILLVHNLYQDQGGEDVVFRQERRLLQEAGHEILEYQRHNNEIKEYSTVRRISLIGRTVWAADSYRDFTALLQESQPEIVHVHNTFPLISPSIYWACQKQGVPVVQTLHNYRLFCAGANFFRAGKPCEDCTTGSVWQSVVHGCYRNSRSETAAVALMLSVHHARKTWLRMVDGYIVLSAFARSRFVNAGLPPEKIMIKANCVDPDPGKRNGRGAYALFVGRVSEEKGTHTLLKAWRQLPRNFTLRIIGDGPARAKLESEATLGGLSNITFMGHLPRERVIQLMKDARFVIFPSQLYENFPLTIIEAFACGVPVIASRLGAMPEIVGDGCCGLLFGAGDPDDLARTVTRAWQQPEYMDRLGEQARTEYESKYTAAANYRKLMEIYRQVVTKHDGEARRLCVEDLREVTSA